MEDRTLTAGSRCQPPARSPGLPAGCRHLPGGVEAPLPANRLGETKSRVPGASPPPAEPGSRPPPPPARAALTSGSSRPPLCSGLLGWGWEAAGAGRARGGGGGLQAGSRGRVFDPDPGARRSGQARAGGRAARLLRGCAQGPGHRGRDLEGVPRGPSPASPRPNTRTCRGPLPDHLATKARLHADRLGPGNFGGGTNANRPIRPLDGLGPCRCLRDRPAGSPGAYSPLTSKDFCQTPENPLLLGD